MAAAGREARERAGDAVVVRFIGATPESSIGRTLLFSLCRQIARRYAGRRARCRGRRRGGQPGPKDEKDIPADYRELSAELPRQLARATRERPLVIFLDALDQLSAADGARGLSWLPRELPEHVRIIVSTATSPAVCLEALKAKLPADSFEELAPMRREEGQELLGFWLERAGRRLQPDQQDFVLDRFAAASVGEGTEDEQGGLPLYLKLAFEEARRWRSHDGVPGLHPTIRGAIRDDLFARLSAEANHGRVFVRHALGYLGAARNGLTEDEMLDVLSRDAEVLADFRRRSPRSPIVEQLPVAVWSRLYFDLEPYLTERSADETSLMGFYHRQLGEVVEGDYLAAEEGLARHGHLAEFFALPEAEDATFTLRQMSELPYQETWAEMWDPLFETLTNFRFLEQKAATGAVESAGDGTAKTYTGISSIQDDFSLALERMPGGDGDGGRRPVIVTATDFGKGAGYQVRCPFCNRYSDLREGWLGTLQACPAGGLWQAAQGQPVQGAGLSRRDERRDCQDAAARCPRSLRSGYRTRGPQPFALARAPLAAAPQPTPVGGGAGHPDPRARVPPKEHARCRSVAADQDPPAGIGGPRPHPHRPYRRGTRLRGEPGRHLHVSASGDRTLPESGPRQPREATPGQVGPEEGESWPQTRTHRGTARCWRPSTRGSDASPITCSRARTSSGSSSTTDSSGKWRRSPRSSSPSSAEGADQVPPRGCGPGPPSGSRRR